MYLKHLTINGFKSFANKTTLEFFAAPQGEAGGKKGITVIVGPNGSGKSNVSDSIRWVMGEQSMKNLRGKKSDDVIFAGSQERSRLSMASVSMTFDNSDKRIPLEYDEVVLTRTIHRNGEGEYRINGSRVRLMDVVDLLAKAGVGKESYCVVNQGMSDAMLLASPQDRRGIFEDAAGVKQYQIKKHRSLRKLDSTRANLERVQGLIVELEPHLKILKRQAVKAQKGKEVYEALKGRQRQYFAYLWHTFQQEHQAALAEKNQVGIEMKNVERAIDQLNDTITAESQKVEKASTIGALEAEKKECYTQLTTLERDIAMAQGKIEIAKERLAHEKAVQSIPVDLVYVQKQVDAIHAEQKVLVEQLEAAKTIEALGPIRTRAQDITARLENLYTEAGKKEISVERSDYAEAVAKHKALIAQKEAEITAGQEQLTKVKAQIAGIDQKVASAIADDHAARQQFFALEKEMRARHEELSGIRERYNDAKIRLAKVEVREEDLQSESREELNTEVQTLEYDGQELDREVTEKEIAKLRSQYEQIGGIDPMVVEEYEETQERFDFLTHESEDLEKAITALKAVIKEMEEKIDQEFARAFTHINKEFSKYFRMIFGGGSAHLSKVKIPLKPKKGEEEDVPEGASEDSQDGEEQPEQAQNKKHQIGIEIVAHPPGKKVKHLSLLSGGERSLTSIALLFAIIAHNPPPFAVLDEVEAALDEANSRRFGLILKDLAADTQFVIISHNRETMRHADALYGVTIGNDGASRVLSVRLDQIGLGGKIETEEA